MGSPFHFLQHMFRTVRSLTKNQEHDPSFPDRLSNLSGEGSAILDIVGCHPAADILGLKCGTDRVGYGLVLARMRNKNCMRQFRRLRLSCGCTV
jgi:hypothetical protein